MAPMGSTGIPVTKMGSVTMVDWAALSSPANRTNFGMAPQQAMEPPPSAGAVDENTPLDLTLEVLFGEDALKFADEYSEKISSAISSWWQKETERMSEQRAAKTEFGESILTAITEGTKGFFSGSAKAFKAVADELNIPTPTRKQSKTVWDQVVSPVINAGQKSASQLFPGVGVASRLVDVITGVVADNVYQGRTSGNLQSIMAAPAKQVAAARQGIALKNQETRDSLQAKLSSAGIFEGMDENLALYTRFRGNIAAAKQATARGLAERTFSSIPLGLDPFAVENADGTYSLRGRFYSAEQEAAFELATPGIYTRDEVIERLQSDPSLLEGSAALRGGNDGRYLTPETILDDEGIFRTVSRMNVSEIASLKMNLFERGYIKSEEEMGRLDTREINMPFLNGFANMIRNAQENGYTWQGWQDQINEKKMYFGGAAQQRQAPLIRVTSPTDIKAVANRVAQQTIGYQLEEGELEQFVSTYQQMERQAQMRAAGGGTVEMAPDIGTAAQEMITGSARKAEADAFAVGNTIDVLRQIISGGGR
jgi:hypothetical protein